MRQPAPAPPPNIGPQSSALWAFPQFHSMGIRPIGEPHRYNGPNQTPNQLCFPYSPPGFTVPNSGVATNVTSPPPLCIFGTACTSPECLLFHPNGKASSVPGKPITKPTTAGMLAPDQALQPQDNQSGPTCGREHILESRGRSRIRSRSEKRSAPPSDNQHQRRHQRKQNTGSKRTKRSRSRTSSSCSRSRRRTSRKDSHHRRKTSRHRRRSTSSSSSTT
jgi:hypothetical protein